MVTLLAVINYHRLQNCQENFSRSRVDLGALSSYNSLQGLIAFSVIRMVKSTSNFLIFWSGSGK